VLVKVEVSIGRRRHRTTGGQVMNATVKDVMTTHVMAVREIASFKEIATRLREQHVSAFPVVDLDGKVIGMVSEADLLPKEALEGTVPGVLHSLGRSREQSRITAVNAADLMTKPAVTIGPDAPVTHAARLMYTRRVKRLPVTNDDGRLIGIVTRSDVLSVYSRPDAEIQRDITQDLILGKLRCDPAAVTVTVKDGIVTIEGTPETAVVGHDLINDARHVEGVVAVRDRLSYPADPPHHPGALS
jgi:CBS domain-containing protein